jgi:hypothetical protein
MFLAGVLSWAGEILRFAYMSHLVAFGRIAVGSFYAGAWWAGW